MVDLFACEGEEHAPAYRGDLGLRNGFESPDLDRPGGNAGGSQVVVYYCRTYTKVVRGGGVKRGNVCYGMLRAAACVDESDHHALVPLRVLFSPQARLT